MSFIAQNKILPGVYTNFTVALQAFTTGKRGTVALPISLPWGEPGKVLTVDDTNALALLGYELDAVELLPIRLALKRATKVLVYRLNTGTKASASIGTGLTVTALWGGARGNDLSVVAKASGDKFQVETYLAGLLVDSQTVPVAGTGFKANGWVTITGTGTLAAATASLSGGADGNVASGALDSALSALELEEFDTITYCGSDYAAVAPKLIAYTAKMAENERNIQCVVVDEGADNERVISLRQSIIGKDGTTWSPQQVAAWLAGATAGAKMTEGNTNTLVENAADVFPRYTRLMQEQAVLAGQCVFDVDSEGVRLVYDIDTLTTYTAQKPKSLRKNKIIRVIYTVDRDIKGILRGEVLGKYPNNEDGRGRIAARLAEYLLEVQAQGAIEGFDPTTDLEILPGTDSDAVLVNYALRPVDSTDKFYCTVEVR